MAGPASTIKAAIVTVLQALKTAGTLGYVLEQDINFDVLTNDIPGFPCAVISQSSMTPTNWEFPQSNKRTYKFDIMVIMSKDALGNCGPGANVEDLRDAIALAFDNSVTLSGAAPLGVQAVASEHAQVSSRSGNSLVVFYVTIKATTLVDLTYNF